MIRAAGAAGLSLLLLSACATPGAPAGCRAGSEMRGLAELYFGRDVGDAPGVSDADWAAFLDQEVTPRFPEGLTVVDGAGQWRGENGEVVREASKVLTLVLSGRPDEPERLEAVRNAYKARFRQEAVMMVERRSCVGF